MRPMRSTASSSPAAAFVLLGVVALATLAAALLHGPALAGLGLVGAYVTPLLVASDHPDYWALYLYLAVVTAAAFALARLRLWRWLAVTAIVFAFLWTFPGIVDGRVDALAAHAFHVRGRLRARRAPDRLGIALRAAGGARADRCGLLRRARRLPGRRRDPGAGEPPRSAGAHRASWRWSSPPARSPGATEAATAAVPAAAVLVAIVFAHWAVNTDILHLIAPGGPVGRRGAGAGAGAIRLASGARHRLCAAVRRRRLSGAGPLRACRWCRCCGAPRRCSRRSPSWSRSTIASPASIARSRSPASRCCWRRSPPVATEALNRRAPRPGLAASGAIFATGAVAALALALTMALDKGWLTVALALMVPGIAWIAEKRPLPALRWLAARRDRAGAGADRARAAHRRRRRRHDADLQLAALRLRHSGRRVLARRPSAAAARRRRAGAHGGCWPRSCSRCCSRSSKSAIS